MSLQMHLPRSRILSHTTWPMTPHVRPMHHATVRHRANAPPRSVAGIADVHEPDRPILAIQVHRQPLWGAVP
eukprot:4359671-Pleurochrysis_carterae.AAC.1